MKKNIFKIILSLFIVSSLFLCLGFKSKASNDNIEVKLEQQENKTNDKIRYILTLSNVTDLSSIESITVNLFIYKYGEGSKEATDTINKVYTNVSGTNGKEKQDNTYYAIYILTGLKENFDDYTLSVSMSLNMESNTLESNLVSYTIGDNTDTFFMGMDTSAVPALEASGVTYKDDNGNTEDVFRVLADHGINYIRVRVWNDPYYHDGDNSYSYGGGNCDLDNAIAIGKRANKYGMKLLVDFQYSDFWSDPAKQKLPKAWVGYTDSQIEDAIYNYTKESLTTMKNAGIDVGMVQIGNETNDAMCGHSGDSSMEAICNFFKAGSLAVREIYSNAKVAVHFANPSNYDTYLWYASELNKYSVDYDVFGTSYYPYWHGSLNNLSKLLSEIATTYNKKVCVLETAYANTESYTDSRSDGYNNTVWTREFALSSDTNGSLPYEFSVDGQKNAIINLIDTIANKTTNGLGIFYWEGTWIKSPNASASVEGSYSSDSETYGTGWCSKYAYYYDSKNYSFENGGCVIENEAFFDENGNPFESLDAFMTDTTSTITRSNSGYAAANLTNGSFEDVSLDGWNLSTSISGTWPKKDSKSDGSYGLSFGSSSSYELTISQDISYISFGTYKFSFDVMGNYSTNAKVFVKVNGVETSTNATLTGEWDSYTTYTVTFSANFTDTVEVGFYISDQNVWGYIDNATLTRIDNKPISSNPIFVNDIDNGTFDTNYSDWTLTDNASLDTIEIKTQDGSNNSTDGFHFWSASANDIDFSLSQDVSLNDGYASFSIQISGGVYTDCEIYAYISINGIVSKSTTLESLTDWDNWHTLTVSDIKVCESDTVIVGIYVNIPDAGGWGYIDNATLSIS